MTHSNNLTLLPTRKFKRGYSEQKLRRMRKLNRLSAKRNTAAA